MTTIVTSVRISPETAALRDKELMLELGKVFEAAKNDCFDRINSIPTTPIEGCECGCNKKEATE
jgi:hypothetical protein